MKLVTDFKDYYDEELLNNEADLTYVRNLSNNLSRFDALTFLKNVGYQTIKLMPVNRAYGVKQLVVYTNPNLHNGLGKHIMSLDSAKLMYANKPCSAYYDSSVTYKILQIGCSCYSLEIETKELQELKLKRCTYIGQGVPGGGNMYPMYSIDFVRDDKGNMLACDFDNVVELKHIQGIEQYITPDMVVKDLQKFLENRKSE